MLAQYVYPGAQRVACYPGHTLAFMAALDSNRVLALAPLAAELPNSTMTPIDITGLALRWLSHAA
jgi:hypothetical protein